VFGALKWTIDNITLAAGRRKGGAAGIDAAIKGPAQLASGIHSCTPPINPAHLQMVGAERWSAT